MSLSEGGSLCSREDRAELSLLNGLLKPPGFMEMYRTPLERFEVSVEMFTCVV